MVMADPAVLKVLTELNKKVNSVGGVVNSFVSEDGLQWYRKYSDGWIEQGGYSGDETFGTKQITLLVPFSNTNYTISAVAKTASSVKGIRARILGASTIELQRIDSPNISGWWMACGY